MIIWNATSLRIIFKIWGFLANLLIGFGNALQLLTLRLLSIVKHETDLLLKEEFDEVIRCIPKFLLFVLSI